MTKFIRIENGAVLQAGTDDELVGLVERYLRAEHPELAGTLSRAEILAKAIESGHDPAEEGAMAQVAIDEAKVEAFVGQVATDAGAAISSLLVFLGDKLGLYKALARLGATTPESLAKETGTNARLVREWLSNQAAGGYVTYDAKTQTFTLPAEHALVLADEESPVMLAGFFQAIIAAYLGVDKAETALRTGKGLSWGDHHHELFAGTARFFKPGYAAHLVQEWIPSIPGLHEKLTAGARVADIGCGYGHSTIILAKAYPASTFVGIDYHAPSIEAARKAAAEEGVADRVSFEVGAAEGLAPNGYDVVTFFDCWHDMRDPSGAAKATKHALKPDGIVLAIEPFANDKLEDNLNVVGRVFYGASTVICTPCSLADGGPGLGAQAGEARSKAIWSDAGFRTFRRATETPFNIVYEARP